MTTGVQTTMVALMLAAMVYQIRGNWYVSNGNGEVDLFATFDKNMNGYISKQEFLHLGRDLHSNSTIQFVSSLFWKEDKNHDSEISYKEFSGIKYHVPLNQTFVAADWDCSDTLDLLEYQRTMPKQTQQKIEHLFAQYDINADGELTRREFSAAHPREYRLTYENVHELLLGKITWLINVAQDSATSANQEYLDNIDIAMHTVSSLFRTGQISFERDPNFMLVFETAQGYEVQAPIIAHLLELYTKFKLHSIREVLLLCLRSGANSNAKSPWTIHKHPPLFRALWKLPSDTELLATLLKAGHSVAPFNVEKGLGLSLFHICFHSTEVNVVKKLFVVADQFSIAEELDGQRKTVAEIFKDVADTGMKRSDWQGDLFRVEYVSLLHASPTFAALVDDWNTYGPTDFIDRTVSIALNEEASLVNFRLLLNAGIDLTEISMQQPTDGWNILHILTHFHYARCMQMLFNAVEHQVNFDVVGQPQTSARRTSIIKAAYLSLRQTDHMLGRNPIHFASALFGNTTALQVLRRGENMINHLISKYHISVHTQAYGHLIVDDSPMLQRDKLQNLPSDYVKKTAKFKIAPGILPSHFNDKAQSVDGGGGGGGVTAMNRYRSNEQQRKVKTEVHKRGEDDDVDGGWGRYFGIRSDLEATPLGRCDIKEVHKMPSKKEWAELVLAGEPFIVRNGADQLGLKRHLWKRRNFLATYGNQSVRVGKIPYQRSFASYVPRDPEFEHNPMDDLTTLNEFVQSFHNHGNGADATGIPNYLFTTKFTTDNPSILTSCEEAFDFVMDVGGINLIFEGQFYLGPPASGAPAHWHSAAVNVMAWGKKRWALFPPLNGSFYSIKPSLDFFKWDVPAMEEQNQVVHFTQNSGDILCVPKGWGHATLNIKTSIGIAFEFSHMPTHPSTISYDYFPNFVQNVEQQSKKTIFKLYDGISISQLDGSFPGFAKEYRKEHNHFK